MARSPHDLPKMGYLAASSMLVLALLFPIGLMIFNPTLMFQRGWEQYVGTAIYLWAVVTLGRELWWLWRNEKAFDEASRLLQYIGGAPSVGPGPPGRCRARARWRQSPRGLPATAEFCMYGCVSLWATSVR